MKVSVIISTYNSPEWLEKVLWGYECQNYANFELLIADDGSTDTTKALIDRFKNNSRLCIRHVWHEDEGFQKSKILNRAILASTGDYLIFSDGDCIPRKDFVEVHVQKAQPGYFLSGGYVKLPMETSKAINREAVISGQAFDVRWLSAHGYTRCFKQLKLSSSGWKERLLNALTTCKATWNGHNSSGWKGDLVMVNGFNEDMQYGGQDRELGERLKNIGTHSRQIRYSAICVHLDHQRGYATAASIEKNKLIRKATRRKHKTWTVNGLVKD